MRGMVRSELGIRPQRCRRHRAGDALLFICDIEDAGDVRRGRRGKLVGGNDRDDLVTFREPRGCPGGQNQEKRTNRGGGERQFATRPYLHRRKFGAVRSVIQPLPWHESIATSYITRTSPGWRKGYLSCPR